MEAQHAEIKCDGKLMGWTLDVSARTLPCGCKQEIHRVGIPTTPRKAYETRRWMAICEQCWDAQTHNWDMLKVKWD